MLLWVTLLSLLLIQKFSGIISMSIVWFVLVLYPYLHKDLGYLEETISALSVKKTNVLKVVTGALLIGCFFQMYFLLYMQSQFNLSPFSLGSMLYISMGIATVFATICNAKYHPRAHFLSAAYYFVVSPITMIAIGFEAAIYNNQILLVSLILSLVYALINFLLWLKYKKVNATFEIFCFLILSVWTLHITFI